MLKTEKIHRQSEQLKKLFYSQSLFWGFFWAVCWSLTQRQFQIENILRRYWMIAFGDRKKPKGRTIGSLFDEIGRTLLNQGYERNGLEIPDDEEYNGFIPDWEGWAQSQSQIVNIRPRLFKSKLKTNNQRGGGFPPS